MLTFHVISSPVLEERQLCIHLRHQQCRLAFLPILPAFFIFRLWPTGSYFRVFLPVLIAKHLPVRLIPEVIPALFLTAFTFYCLFVKENKDKTRNGGKEHENMIKRMKQI